MNIHKKIGSAFSTFCLILLGWHLLTPENPHHVINVMLHSVTCFLFFVSTFTSIRVCRYLHPAILLAGASITAWGGNFPVAAIISFVAVFLHYSYGGFHTLSTFRVIGTVIGMFLMFYFSILVSGYGYAPSYAMALVWTTFSLGLFWFVWLILQYFAADIVQQNRDLLELNKELTKGDCADVTKKRG